MKPVDHIFIDGKPYFFINNTFHCGYCGFIQLRQTVRNDEGLIIGFTVKDQQHAEGCKNK